MSKLTLFSPAKINLTLNVVGRRPDGYHNLETLMQTIDLGDTLIVQLARHDVLMCDDAHIPCDSTNFVWRAVQLFRERTGCRFAVHIDLRKKIPERRGLGGGSSNVATTLYALNQLLDQSVAEEELQNWSQEISSDAPFFFSRGTALCTSKGERVENQKMPEERELYLINPGYGLSTKRVFEEFDKHQQSGNLEEAAFSLEPRLRVLKQELQRRFTTVFMTGSGSAFVCEGGKAEGIPIGIPIRFIQRNQAWYQSPYSST